MCAKRGVWARGMSNSFCSPEEIHRQSVHVIAGGTQLSTASTSRRSIFISKLSAPGTVPELVTRLPFPTPIRGIHIIFWLNFNCGVSLLQMQITMTPTSLGDQISFPSDTRKGYRGRMGREPYQPDLGRGVKEGMGQGLEWALINLTCCGDRGGAGPLPSWRWDKETLPHTWVKTLPYLVFRTWSVITKYRILG